MDFSIAALRNRKFFSLRILTSQLPVSRWHEQIGDPTIADGILDRLVHNAHRIEMLGESMRKNRGKPESSV
jgi:DNA replication protein DnaC